MLVPTNHINKIKRHMVEKGCIVVEDTPSGNHPVLKIPNLEVINVLRSLCSKKLVRKVFVWRHGYYFIESEGETKLREELCISEMDLMGKAMNETGIYEARMVE